jgi:DNA-binding NarL/FixJ family response regulator
MCAEKPTQGSRNLTLRQKEVLQLLVKGSTMRQAAVALGLKTRTIAYHKYHIMKQFHLETNTDLIRFAMNEQLVPSIRRKRPEDSLRPEEKSRDTGG